MQHVIAVCIEREATSEQEPFIRCTARSGREAGLAIGIDGSILWCSKDNVACDLWVTNDDRLVVVRAITTNTLSIERGRRGLELPIGRAVVVLDQDVIIVDARRFRVHVHGITDTVHPPQPLRVARGMAVIAAMAMTVGCVDGGTDEPPPVGTGGSTSGSTSTGGSGNSSFTSPGSSVGGFTTTSGGNTGTHPSGAGGTSERNSIETIEFPPFI